MARPEAGADRRPSQRVVSRGLGPRAAVLAVLAVFIAVLSPALLRAWPHPPLPTPIAEESDQVAVVETPPAPAPSARPVYTTSDYQRCSQVSRDETGKLTTARDWTLVLDDRADLAWHCLIHPDQPLPDFQAGIWAVPARDDSVGSQLEVVWLGDPCRDEVVIRTERARGPMVEPRYTLEVDELDGGRPCTGFVVERSAVLFMQGGIDADTIFTSKAPTTAFGIPPAAGSERLIRCALPAAVEITDSTGLVTGCESSPHDDRSELISVDNPNGDRTRLRVRWLGESCGIGTSIRLVPLGDSVGLLVRPTLHRRCEGWQFPLGLTFTLGGEVGAESVVAVRRLRLFDGP